MYFFLFFWFQEVIKTTGDPGAEEAEDSEDDEDPDDRTALAIYRENAQAEDGRETGFVVAVGHINQTLTVLDTAGAIKLLHKALGLLVGNLKDKSNLKGVLDFIFDVTYDSVGCSCQHKNSQNLDQNKSCLPHLEYLNFFSLAVYAMTTDCWLLMDEVLRWVFIPIQEHRFDPSLTSIYSTTWTYP